MQKFLLAKLKKNFVPGEDYFISFAPERTVEGNALYELENNPQIIGADDLVSFEKTSNIFNKLTTSIIKVDNIKSAEFAKLVDNSYRDHKFSYSNQLIEPCEKLKINLNAIIDAVNFGYGRNDIAKPSPGVGAFIPEPIHKAISEPTLGGLDVLSHVELGLDLAIIDAS